jgi:peptide subunit release factor 1 (eRF1)
LDLAHLPNYANRKLGKAQRGGRRHKMLSRPDEQLGVEFVRQVPELDADCPWR